MIFIITCIYAHVYMSIEEEIFIENVESLLYHMSVGNSNNDKDNLEYGNEMRRI